MLFIKPGITDDQKLKNKQKVIENKNNIGIAQVLLEEN